MAKAAWEKDAEEFGRRFAFGEWDSALLVARSVVHSSKSGPNFTHVKLGKASAAEFGKQARVSGETIRAYFKTWKLAADDLEWLPAPDDLKPGQPVEVLPSADDWDHYFRLANPARTKAVSPKAGLDVAAGAAIADATTTLTRAVNLVQQAAEAGILDDRRKANLEILLREIEAQVAEARQYLDVADLDAELAELLQGGM